MSQQNIPGSEQQPQNNERPRDTSQPKGGQGPDNFDRFRTTPLGDMAKLTPGGEMVTNLTVPEHPGSIDRDTHQVKVEKVPPAGMPPSVETVRGRSRRRFWGVVAAAGVVLGAGGTVAAIQNNDNPAPNPTPVDSAPVTPGPSNSPEAPQPSASPEDPEKSIANEGKTELEKQLAERAPLYENPFNSKDFSKLVMADSSRALFAKKYGYTHIKPSELPLNEPVFNAETERGLLVENVLPTYKELSKAFSDGSLEKAIAKSNETMGTNYTLADFYIEKSEIPTARTEANKAEVAKYLADVSEITHRFRTLAVAMIRNETDNPSAAPNESPLSTRLIYMSHLSGKDRTEQMNKNAEFFSDSRLPYTPDSVIPSSVLLDFAVEGMSGNGFQIEREKGGLKDMYVPLIGMIEKIDTNDPGRSGTAITLGRQETEVMSWHTIVPVQVEGKTVGIPLLVGQTQFASK